MKGDGDAGALLRFLREAYEPAEPALAVVGLLLLLGWPVAVWALVKLQRLVHELLRPECYCCRVEGVFLACQHHRSQGWRSDPIPDHLRARPVPGVRAGADAPRSHEDGPGGPEAPA